jgi:hypothetical protein
MRREQGGQGRRELRAGIFHNEAFSTGCREGDLCLAAVFDVERGDLCQQPSPVDGKGSYVSDIRTGSRFDFVSLGHALGDHDLAVVAACLKPQTNGLASRVVAVAKADALIDELRRGSVCVDR